MEAFYEPWSYTASTGIGITPIGNFANPILPPSFTGFDDSLQSLEKLSGIKFDVPIDLAVRQLKNISEAF